jgi:hypothetical protein
MWMSELTTNTNTAESRIGNHSDVSETIGTSWMLGSTGRFGIEPLLLALYHASCKVRGLRHDFGESLTAHPIRFLPLRSSTIRAAVGEPSEYE